mmetsp:Transcript_43702/g.86694  ORF Transcript_43702/g.86694 Transcript_43702/m.86694 type:complete len:119 (+) Transcript_43702:184-540(+)
MHSAVTLLATVCYLGDTTGMWRDPHQVILLLAGAVVAGKNLVDECGDPLPGKGPNDCSMLGGLWICCWLYTGSVPDTPAGRGESEPVLEREHPLNRCVLTEKPALAPASAAFPLFVPG